jgi:lysophospholipase L1-like esterase
MGALRLCFVRSILASRGFLPKTSMRCVLLATLSLVSSVLAEDFKLSVRNLDMETGVDIPEGWSATFGKVYAKRDTETVHGGKASLSVQNSSSSSGSVHQMIPVEPGLKIKLGGYMKCAEGSKASFGAQFFDEKFTWNEFVKVRRQEGVQDWQFGELEITVPERASRMAIALYVEGVGRAWLDDVTLSGEGASVVMLPPAESGPVAPREPEEAKLIPVTPLPGYFAGHPKVWTIYHEQNLKRAKEGSVDVLFLGDSITQGWSGVGKEHWEKNFVPLKAANFGIGGDKTGNVLWRIEHGEVDGISPKLVVLMIGVNNIWSGKNSGEEIAGGVRAIVEKLRAKLPQTKVLVLGVLPIGDKGEDLGRFRVKEINDHAAKLDDGATVRFFDVGARLLQKNGKLLEGAYGPDNVHLTAKGYEVLAKELAPIVAGLVK